MCVTPLFNFETYPMRTVCAIFLAPIDIRLFPTTLPSRSLTGTLVDMRRSANFSSFACFDGLASHAFWNRCCWLGVRNASSFLATPCIFLFVIALAAFWIWSRRWAATAALVGLCRPCVICPSLLRCKWCSKDCFWFLWCAARDTCWVVCAFNNFWTLFNRSIDCFRISIQFCTSCWVPLS